MVPALDILARSAQSGRRTTNLTQFIAWPSCPLRDCLYLMEELGAPAFLGLKTSQTFYGPDSKGESGSMNWTKVVVGGQKSNFFVSYSSQAIILQSVSVIFFQLHYWRWSPNFNQEVSSFQSCSCIFEVHWSEVEGFLMQGSKLLPVHSYPRWPQCPPIHWSCRSVIYNRWLTLWYVCTKTRWGTGSSNICPQHQLEP